MSRIVFVAPLSALSRRTRLFKISKYLYNSKNSNIFHIGWERIDGEADETALNFEVRKKIILKGGGYGGKLVKLYYFLWMFKVFLYSFQFKKSDIVWALGFESSFPLLLASKIIGFKIYFDDADRFSMLFSFPKPIKFILQKLEEFTSKNVYKHIIPVIERYNFVSPTFFILQNFPSNSELVSAKEQFLKNSYITDKIVINVNGWLGDNRGMNVINKLCKDEINGLSFIVAGKLDSKDAKELVKYKNVQYLGQVSNSQALASYFASDFVFTYYKPNSEINNLAASNKWGDAIMTNIGIIVNEEVKTAKYLKDSEVAIYVPYQNYDFLKTTLEKLLSAPHLIDEYKIASKKLSKEFGYFEDQLKSLMS